jgi:hypothetical protein
MGRTAAQDDVLEELDFTHEKKHPHTTTESLAADILNTLYAADTNDENLAQRLEDVVHTTGWYHQLAVAVFTGMENALRAEAPMGQAMKDAYEKASQVVADVLQFAKEHPVFCTLVAVGILVILAPWAIEWVGFAEEGPVAGMCVYVQGDTMLICCLLVGTFAALWQARYAGYVPKGSLFSFFQRLGMVWRLKWVSSPAMTISAT